MPLFISLDGVDGAGKSTQCRLLADWLRPQGRDVVTCADPGGTAVGDQLRQILLHHRHDLAPTCEALLFMASRAQLLAEVIRPALAAQRDVVCDRYLLANVVYQGHAGGLDPQQLWQVGQWAAQGLTPNLTVVLDLPADVAHTRRRGPADRIEQRGLDYHRQVRAGFLAEAKSQPDRIAVVDANRPIDAVQEHIRRLVEPLLTQ
jgi:dTMP kinase